MASDIGGTFLLYNAANTACVLTVASNGLKDGSNVQISTYQAGSDAQIFNVRASRVAALLDGSYEKRIVNRLSGKCLDVDSAKTATGTNVQIWTNVDVNWQGQRLVLTATGYAVTINGTNYPTYNISMSNNTGMVFAATSTSSGANVQLQAASSAGQRGRWALVPVSPSLYNGLFEILPMSSTSMAVSVYNGGKVNGTNVSIGVCDDRNAQKFYVYQEDAGIAGEGAKWSIRACDSGKYVDVDSAKAQSGANVQIWDDNDTRAQRWKFIPYGTTTYAGKTVNTYRIGSYVTDDGETYFLDVAGTYTNILSNVQIATMASGDLGQIFALVPTDAEDAGMPVPYDLQLADDVPGNGVDFGLSGDKYYFPAWKCSDAWVTAGPNHYEYRTRRRFLYTLNNTWSDWTTWTAWDTPSATVDGVTVYENNGVKVDYDWDDFKNYQIEFQVRSAGVWDYHNDTRQLHGTAADKVVNWYKVPEVEWTSAGWSPEGLRLAWASDYEYGTTDMRIRQIADADGSNMLRGDYGIKGTSLNSSALIPLEEFTGWPDDGDTVSLGYLLGYDQRTGLAEASDDVEVSYDAGTVDVSPFFLKKGYKLSALVRLEGDVRMWVRTPDGTLRECYETENQYSWPVAGTWFDVPYPIGTDYDVFVSYSNADGSKWGTAHVARDAEPGRFHAFSYDGGSVYIEQFLELGENYNITNEPVYQADVLDSREHESVSYAATVRTQVQISGVISDTSTSTLDELNAMLKAGHVFYRSPDGQMFDAAVTKLNATIRNNRIEVSIDLVRETI